MKGVRLERINAELQKAISHIIDNDLRDPQINAIISVSQVSVTPDLGYARVYLTSIGATPTKEVVNRIKGAGGFIRGKLSQMVKLRITPRLEFIQDTTEEYADKIENILKGIKYTTPEEPADGNKEE